MYSSEPNLTDELMLDDQVETIYNRSVLIEDVPWKTCWGRWMVETSGERGSVKSVPADIYIYIYIYIYIIYIYIYI